MPNSHTNRNKKNQPKKIKQTKSPLYNRVDNTEYKQANSNKQAKRPENSTYNKIDDGKGDTMNWIEKKHPIISTIANVIMALGTIIAVIISARSLKISNESLILTQKSIEGSNIKDSSIISFAKRTSDAADLQAQASIKANKISENYARFYAQSAIKEGRAYIINNETKCYNRGKYLTYAIGITNVGKTPAYNVIAKFFIYGGRDEFYGVDSLVQGYNKTAPTFTLSAQQSHSVTADDSTFFSANMIDAMNARNNNIYVALCITYSDSYSNQHRTHFHGYYDKKMKTVLMCKTYNESD